MIENISIVCTCLRTFPQFESKRKLRVLREIWNCWTGMQSSGLIREGFVFNYDISFVGLSVSWYSFQFNLSVHSNSITGINTGLFFFFFLLSCTVHLDIVKVFICFHQRMHYIFAQEYIKICIKIYINTLSEESKTTYLNRVF